MCVFCCGQCVRHLPQDFGTVVVVLHGVFDEAEAIYITNEGVAVGSEQVEPAHRLLKSHRDVPQRGEENTTKHNFSLFLSDGGNMMMIKQRKHMYRE